MKKLIIVLLLIFLSSFASAIWLSTQEKIYDVKINILNQNMVKSYEELQILKAQWTKLNNTEYLKELSQKYLPDFIKQPHKK